MSNSFNKYSMGLGHVGSFQTSARPFLSSSLNIPDNTSDPLVIQFDTVSRFIVISNNSLASDPARPFRFGFSANGVAGAVNNNYIILSNGETFEAEFKVSEVYLISNTAFAATGSVVAGLTGISRTHLLNNYSGSAGIG
jgi:hypothetical protein